MTGLPPEMLRKIVRYEPDTGRFYWLPRTEDMFCAGGHSAAHSCAQWNTRYAGKEAFIHADRKGYRRAPILGRSYAAHRVAFAIMTGRWPEEQVDHADRDPSNNAWANLREATRFENARNQRIRSSNRSGAKGVSWHKKTNKWQARITIDRRIKHLGVFTCRTAAALAYARASVAFHGQFGCPK